MAALEMLNIMETAPASPLGAFSAIEMHKRIESMKLAYADVHRYDADPHTYDVPVAQLLSKEYARKRAALIDPNKANCTVPPGQPIGSDTTYLTVVDKDGNMASWIESVYAEFGSGVTVDGMGFLLQNRGGLRWSRIIPTFRRQAAVPSSRRSWSAAICISDSASWAAQIAARARAVRLECGGLRHECAGRAGAPRFTKRNSTGCDAD
jgi:hypothetical protein